MDRPTDSARLRFSWGLLIAVGFLGFTPAHAGCEYVQTGPTAGDFIMDCGGGTPGKPMDPNPDSYLSIAMSPQYAVGAGWGPDPESTEKKALAECQSHGGQGCRVIHTYHNTCASVAVSTSRKIIAIEEMPGQGWNGSEMARRKCESSGGQACRPIIAACANGYVSPTPWVPASRGDASQAPVLRRR